MKKKMIRHTLPVILIFLKAPIPGTVKTRLACNLGDLEACRIYKLLVRRQLQNLPDGWPVKVYYTGVENSNDIRQWLGQKSFDYRQQSRGDLGRRLSNAFKQTLEERQTTSVIAIGADCPYLDEAVFEEAAERLQEVDVIFGPACDGGYYLIGMKKFIEPCFENIAWGGSEVLIDSLRQVSDIGCSSAQLSLLEDIDDISSWSRFTQVLDIEEQRTQRKKYINEQIF